MKRTRIIFALFFISFLPFSLISGQGKKNEEKIKIVIADKSGADILIDTTFTGDNKLDSIKLKDGTIVYIGKNPDEESLKGTRRIYVTSPEDKNSKKIIREVTVISSDSDKLAALDEKIGDNVFVYSHSGDKTSGQEKGYKVITRVGNDGDKSDMKYIYISDDKEAGKSSGEKFNIRIDKDEIDYNPDNTKHIIAKDGIVVTIEGNDEAKINELLKEVEKSLDAGKEKPASKPAVK